MEPTLPQRADHNAQVWHGFQGGVIGPQVQHCACFSLLVALCSHDESPRELILSAVGQAEARFSSYIFLGGGRWTTKSIRKPPWHSVGVGVDEAPATVVIQRYPDALLGDT